MSISSIVLIGAGGHAKVVLDALLRIDANACVTVRDDAPQGRRLLGLPVAAPAIPPHLSDGHRVHVAIGDNRTRGAMLKHVCSVGATAHTIVHPNANLASTAEIGPGGFVAAGAVVAPSAQVGRGGILNHNTVVDHDCRIGDCVHIAPGATLGGGVRVGAYTLIGAGAIMLPGVRIGADCIVGAGAVVIRDIPDGLTVTGVPAKPDAT